MNHEDGELIEKNSSGATIFNYILETSIIEVQSLQFDGYYFWSLEKQGTSGFRVRKWEIGGDNIVRIVNQFSFATDAINKYNVNALAVEWYSDSLDNSVLSTQVTFDVNDGTEIRIGDRIKIGPSTAVGYVGQFANAIVIDKPTDTTVTVNAPLGVSFSPDDELVFTRSFFVFSDTAPGNQKGALYKYRATDGFPLSLNVSNMFNLVRAATFFQDKLMFVRGGEIIWLNPVTQNIFKSQAIDNLDENRSNYIDTFDLDGFSNTIYRLEQKHVFLDDDTYDTEEWAPLYNYNTSSVVSDVFFVAVKAEPPILITSNVGVPATETKSTITVHVLDQFRTPVFGRIVNFTSTGGPLSSIQETTDANGFVKTEYTSNTAEGEITITAEVV